MEVLRKLFDLLTSFDGRINRAKWWLGLVITGVASAAGGLILNPDYFTSEEMPPPTWPDTLWQIMLLWPVTAMTVKRFNDTARPWWLGYLFAPLGVVLYLVPHLTRETGGVNQATMLTIILPMAAYFIFAFIDNGFIRGTTGANRFGPDPLAGKTA